MTCPPNWLSKLKQLQISLSNGKGLAIPTTQIFRKITAVLYPKRKAMSSWHKFLIRPNQAVAVPWAIFQAPSGQASSQSCARCLRHSSCGLAAWYPDSTWPTCRRTAMKKRKKKKIQNQIGVQKKMNPKAVLSSKLQTAQSAYSIYSRRWMAVEAAKAWNSWKVIRTSACKTMR